MKVSNAAKVSALKSLLSCALSSPSDLSKHREGLSGLRLLDDSNDEGKSNSRVLHLHSIDEMFASGFQLADRQLVSNICRIHQWINLERQSKPNLAEVVVRI